MNPTSLHLGAPAPGRERALAITLLAAAVAIVGAIQLAAATSEQLVTLNSDQLYLPSLYRDLFVEHGDLRHWVLPPAPSFFPDFVLYAAAERLTTSVGAAFMVTVGIQLLLVLALGAILLRARAASGWLGVPVLETVASGTLLLALLSDHPLRHDFFSVAHHGGVLVVGLAIAVLWWRALDRWRLAEGALLALLAFLGAVSDLIFLPQILLPLCGASLVLVRARVCGWRGALRPLLAALLGLLLALGFNAALAARTAREADVPHAAASSTSGLLHLAPPVVRANVVAFARSLGVPFALLLAASVVVAGLALVRTWRQPPDRERRRALFVCVFFLACMACTACAPIFTVGPDPRYELPLYFLPALVLPRCLELLRWRVAHRLFLPALCTLAIPAVSHLWARSSEQVAVGLPSTEPVACLDRVTEDQGLEYGFGDYWHARYASFHSRRHLFMNELSKTLGPRVWIGSRAWYARVPAAKPERVFVISAGLPVDRLPDVLGPPLTTTSCGEFDVYTYEYARLSSAAKDALGASVN